jgi:hypothetical protein
MSSVTNGKAMLEYATQIREKISMDVPVSVKGSDLYIIFGETAFSNPLLLKASKLGGSLNELLGLGATAEKEYELQMTHAREWLGKVELGAVASRDPNDWLVHCSEKGCLNHILWCLAHKRDVVSQFYWAHDMVNVSCVDLHKRLTDLAPDTPCIGSSRKGIGLSKNHDGRSKPNRRQEHEMTRFKGFPSHRRGKQPRGKCLADKRSANLNRSYQKAYSR